MASRQNNDVIYERKRRMKEIREIHFGIIYKLSIVNAHACADTLNDESEFEANAYPNRNRVYDSTSMVVCVIHIYFYGFLFYYIECGKNVKPTEHTIYWRFFAAYLIELNWIANRFLSPLCNCKLYNCFCFFKKKNPKLKIFVQHFEIWYLYQWWIVHFFFWSFECEREISFRISTSCGSSKCQKEHL